ncbi:hypothetical protein K8M07_04830 [Schnuerera sp. xch1]|uniref:hypothetical protein n=1 Tax=Schnuerera sp. xch1 TaxID=2874283 RepID=UPI001CBE9009|nr:hypothetical protein [Schnuerera sp. xch1]MBZ2174567.1 hypothetical protein [Schnuerera sp. xch1]
MKLLLAGVLFLIFFNNSVSFYFYFILGGIVLLELLSYIFKNKTDSKKSIENGVEEVANGNLSKKFHTKNKAYDKIARNLNKILDNYRGALSQIAYSSQKILGITNDLALATNETNQSINEVAQAIESISIGAEEQKNKVEEVLSMNNNLKLLS